MSVEEKEKPMTFPSNGCSAQKWNSLLSNVFLNYCIRNNTGIVIMFTQLLYFEKENREIYFPSISVQIIEVSRRDHI